MKAVIVECSNSTAIALCDDGSFKRLRNQGYSIGQELLIKQKVSKNRTIRRLSICASLALFLSAFVGVGSYSYVHPYSYVSLDINPSIEYALNRYDKVIKVAGMNDDGRQIVSSIESNVTNKNITAALNATIEQLERDNYISPKEESHMIISVCSNNHSKAESLASKVNNLSEEKASLCSIDTVTVSQEIKDDADSLGITPGKLALIQAVAETSPDENFNVSDWTDKTVAELENTIQQASTDSAQSGMPDSVADNEFTGSVLDDSSMSNPSDSAIIASTEGADAAKDSSVTDDNQTEVTNTNTTPSAADIDPETSSQKPDINSATAQTGIDDESASTTVKPEDTDPATQPDSSETALPDTTSDPEAELTVSDETSTQKPDTDTPAEGTTSKPTDDATGASTSKNSSDESMNASNSTSKNSPYQEGHSSESVIDQETVPSTPEESAEEPVIVTPSSSKKSALPQESGTAGLDESDTEPDVLDSNADKFDSNANNVDSNPDELPANESVPQ